MIPCRRPFVFQSILYMCNEGSGSFFLLIRLAWTDYDVPESQNTFLGIGAVG